MGRVRHSHQDIVEARRVVCPSPLSPPLYSEAVSELVDADKVGGLDVGTEAAAGGERPTEATALADIENSNEITVSARALRLAISLSARELLQNAECATDQKNKAANRS